jgi:general stress protein 26
MRIGSALANVLVIAGVSVEPAVAQPTRPAATREAIIKAAIEVMGAARYSTLVTMDGEQPQARVVDPFAPDPDMTVWIATKPVTRKVAQIKKNPRVALLYFDQKASAYVTLVGQAALVNDPQEKSKRWKEVWAPLYKDRNKGDDYLLLRVTPERLEISSPAHGLQNDPGTWRPVVLVLR